MKRISLLFALAALALSLGGCNWIKGLGKKDNVEPPTPLTEFTPTAQVDRAWSEGVGDGAGDSGALLAPVHADGRLYVASVDGTIEAIDMASGRTLWNRRLGERKGMFWRRGEGSLRWAGGPGVDGDLLVAGSLDGHVQALGAADGTDRWSVDLGAEIIARPAIANGIVVVRTNAGSLVGLDATDGSRRWVFEQPVPPLSLRGNSSPLILNGVVYSGFDNGRIVAVRLDDGAELWVQTLSPGEGRTEVERLSDVDGDIATDGATLYSAGYRGQLIAFTPDAGRPLWQREFSSYAGVAVGGEVVVAVDADGNVWAFDRGTGANLWKQDALKFRWLSAPAIQGDYVVVGDGEGYVHWLSVAEGKFVARERLGRKPIEASPLVVGDLVCIEDVKGRIGAWRIRQ
jgi:outer membrane protein assembly factor BamB